MDNNKIKRLHNPNIDAIKIVAISMVVLVHIANVYERFPTSEAAYMIFSSFGYVGVTFFLMLSGYNIYQLLERKKQPYLQYVYGRFKKLSPHYYISLLASLTLTASAAYISPSGVMNIVSHIFYFHNLFYNFHGAINGVCWTLGVIFQFYLVAPLLKKAIDRYPPLVIISLSMLLTVLIKAILFLWVFPKNNADSFYYFIYGGQLYTSLDIFVIGMYISKTKNDTPKSNNLVNYLLTVLGCVVLCLYILFISGYGRPYPAGIYTSSKTSVLAFTGLEIIIAFIIIFFNKIKLSDGMVGLISFFGKSQYSLYIWHLLILRVVINDSPVFRYIADRNIYLGFIAAFVFICVVAAIIDVFVSNINTDKVIEAFKDFFKIKRSNKSGGE